MFQAIGHFIVSLAVAIGSFLGYTQPADFLPTGATGSEIPTVVALFETSLASNISSSATSMTLVSATDKAGGTLSGTYPMIIDEGTASEEMVLADCTGTSCSGMIRGISPVTGTTTVSTLKFAHRRGSSVKITDGPQLNILSRLLNGQGYLPNKITYASHPGSFNPHDLIDYQELTDTAFGSTPVSVTAGGTGVQTLPQDMLLVGNGTGNMTSTSSPTVGYLTATSTATSTFGGGLSLSAGPLYVATTSPTATSTFQGPLASNATTTIACKTNDVLILNGVPYTCPSSQGASNTFLKNSDGAGTLTWAAVTPDRYGYATTTETTVSAGTTATSTGFFTVPAGVATASSTIEFKGGMGSCNNSSGGGSCTLYVRDSTGKTLLSYSVSADNGENAGASIGLGTIVFNNSTSAEKGIMPAFGVNPGTPTSSQGQVGATSGTVDFSSAVTFAVVVETSSNTSSTIKPYSIVLSK